MSQVVRILAAIFATALLMGCQTTQPTTAVVTVEKPTLMLPNVDQVQLSDVEWYIINKNAKTGADDHIDTTFRTANSDTLFAITPKDYEDMAINQANLVKIIRQYQAQLGAYKKYYDAQATKADTTKTTTGTK